MKFVTYYMNKNLHYYENNTIKTPGNFYNFYKL